MMDFWNGDLLDLWAAGKGDFGWLIILEFWNYYSHNPCIDRVLGVLGVGWILCVFSGFLEYLWRLAFWIAGILLMLEFWNKRGRAEVWSSGIHS
ncbi:MAG: hypothetical protein AAF050_00350 [Cyanobacteria bacterium J06649_5]